MPREARIFEASEIIPISEIKGRRLIDGIGVIPIPVLNSGCSSKEREAQQGKRI
jgi:hypothetical protein